MDSKKRKVVTRDVDPTEVVSVSGDEFDFGQLNGHLEDEDSDSVQSDLAVDSSDDELGAGKSTSVSDLGSIDEAGLVDKAGDLQVHGPGSVTEDQELNYRIDTDANGNERYVYDEIDPGDDSEYSVPEDEANTIGNIPLSYYDSFPHIGYNINGKKIMRPATGKALDALLDSIDVPKGFTGLTDPNTGKPLELSRDELQLLRKVQLQEVAEDGYNPYEPMVEWFTSQVETMPLSAAPEPKRRFVPSKHEQKRIMKIVRAIKEGRIQPYKPPQDIEEEDETANYDIWSDEKPRTDLAMHMPAPKLPPPGFDESYHPPPEYLPDQEEKKAWEEQDEEDRDKDYLPEDHSALRKVPGYGRFVKEKFERCLDLYLAPRVHHTKLNIDPESLLPKLPDPNELRPFPAVQTTIFRGHVGRVRSVSIDPTGLYLATGGDDGTARVWTVSDARQVWSVKFGSDSPVNVVRWRPGKDTLILAIAAGDTIHLAAPLIPEGITSELATTSQAVLDQGWGTATNGAEAKSSALPWQRPTPAQQAKGVTISVHFGHTPKSLSWHSGGNYLVAVCPATTVPSSYAVSIHTINKHQTQLPFKKRIRGGGTPQTAHFHPSKPVLFVANQRVIRAYDLTKQSLLKIIRPGARWISSFSVHPTSTSISGSDNLLVGSYDRRLLWMDLDLSLRPYKTLRYHQKAIRAVEFHPNVNRYPLFADASDDGTVQVFHGLVTSDMMSNATIVPLKVLRGHQVTSGGLGVMDLTWHPTEPWLVSAGADGTARLWMS